jgi:hypothetical protein
MLRITTTCQVLAAFAKVDRGSSFVDLYLWVGILMALLMALGMVWMIIRGRVGKDDSSETDIFSLGALRKMHREGQLSDEEFEKAKVLVIGAYAGKSSDSTQADSDKPVIPDKPSPSDDAPEPDAPEPDPDSSPPSLGDPTADEGQTGDHD